LLLGRVSNHRARIYSSLHGDYGENSNGVIRFPTIVHSFISMIPLM